MPTAKKPAKGSRTTSRSTAKRATAKRPAAKRASAKRPSAKRATTNRATTNRAAANRPAAKSPSTSSQNSNGSVTETIKHAASRAKAPVVAAGAAAAGIAGGLVLKSRKSRKTVMGVTVPKALSDIDARSVAKAVGNATQQFAKTSKSVSKDLDRAGDQAERIGKILK
jgi:hypothetical protein